MTTHEKLKKAYTDAVTAGTQAEGCMLASLMGALETMAECPEAFDHTTIECLAEIAFQCTDRHAGADIAIAFPNIRRSDTP